MGSATFEVSLSIDVARSGRALAQVPKIPRRITLVLNLRRITIEGALLFGGKAAETHQGHHPVILDVAFPLLILIRATSVACLCRPLPFFLFPLLLFVFFVLRPDFSHSCFKV